MIIKKVLAAGMIGCALIASGGAIAAGDLSQGAFDGVNKLLSGQGNAIAEDNSPEGLKLRTDALAAAIAALQGSPFGTSTETAKLTELAHVVSQLRENIAAASSDPGELAFLTDEFESLQGQFADLGFTVLKREANALAAAVTALQAEDRSGPEAALAKLAQIASATAQVKQSVTNAAAQRDAGKVVPLFTEVRTLRAQLDGLRNQLFENLVTLVNGMIGTGQIPKSDTGSNEDMLGGFVNPVANLPFGMMTWGPETTSVPGTWSPRGYHYPMKTITGFPLKNLSGVGCPSGGQFRFMPVLTASQSSSGYEYADQKSLPGYYTVKLDSGIQTELTATPRSGVGRFTYPTNSTPILRIFGPSNPTVDLANKTISGSQSGGGFCNNGQSYTVHFYAKFDTSFTASGSTLTFAGNAGKPTPIGVKVGMSYVSVDNARLNLETETASLTFDQARRNATHTWNNRLNSIQVSGGTNDNKVQFYTALYHAYFAPQVYSDVNGDYMSMASSPARVNAGAGRTQYTTFSSWDSYRSLVPLQAILAPKEVSDHSQSLVNFASQCGPNGTLGSFPMWAEGNTNSNIMPGDGASILVAQSYAFGARSFDTAKAKDIMIGTANNTLRACRNVTTRPGQANYLSKGFLSTSDASESVSTNFENASTDFAASRFVAALAAESQDAANLLRLSGNWANGFNPDWKNVAGQPHPQPQPRNTNGSWQSYFFFGGQNTHFREGNAEQYTYMVHHDTRSLFKKLIVDETQNANSEADAISRLDVFNRHLNGGMEQPYLYIGNEPTFGVPFMYNWTSQPYKSQALVRRIIREQFASTPEGLPGNDDEGAMSGWFVWAALGLYPEVLAVPGVTLTSPLFEKAVIYREGQPFIEINAENAPAQYIESVKVDGQSYDSTWLGLDLSRPMKIDFKLGAAPTCWGSNPTDDKLPPSYAPDGTQTPRLQGSCGLQ